MLSINTNISSLIAQQSMTSATNKLNQAIERMTTGYKINGAKDNAANYSISQNMQTQLSSYDVAADNVAMGMDLVTTASDIINNMQDKATRLQALCTQARNGTYGTQSMAAINSEAGAIMAEINRLYSTAEYNSVSLFNREAYTIADHLPKAGASGFIDETADVTMPEAKEEYNGFIKDPKTYTDAEVAAMTRVADVSSFSSGQKYSISSEAEFEKFRDLVNTGASTTGIEIVLATDIDFSKIIDWVYIGGVYEYEYEDVVDYDENGDPIFGTVTDIYSNSFEGTLNGNGHIIKNQTKSLFWDCVTCSNVKNIGFENVSLGADSSGVLGPDICATAENCYVQGEANGSGYLLAGWIDYVDSCYAIGKIVTDGSAGGLVMSSYEISNSFTDVNIVGGNSVGGILSGNYEARISNCYSLGDVQGHNDVGGISAGEVYSVSNCYSTGNITGNNNVAGIAANLYYSIENCYSTGNITGNSSVAGIVTNYTDFTAYIENCYSTGDISGTGFAIAGIASSGEHLYMEYQVLFQNCYSTGNITGKNCVGGITGSQGEFVNCYTTGKIKGEMSVGGLTGCIDLYNGYDDLWNNVTIKNSISYSEVSGKDVKTTGALVGSLINTADEVTFAELRFQDCQAVAQYGTDYIGGCFKSTGDPIVYDMTTMLSGISAVEFKNIMTSLQVGINSDSSCQITFDTNFKFDLSALENNIASDEALSAIMEFSNLLSEKSTQLGAVQNRLDSALESITVNMENLTSSLSTIRDADIAEVSSTYIQQQILQQASATLLATANQSPSIALQLI